MKKEYQIWGFVYLALDGDGMNIITKNREESDTEYEIPCFDGFAYIRTFGKRYIATYPKFDELTKSDKIAIRDYCGYIPKRGEYGVIMGALGVIKETDRAMYDMYKRCHPISEEDRKRIFY